jgi:gluconate 2-dehydrogenase gamma chain
MSDQAAFMFLNDTEVATVEALAECIFPADASGPGAREAQAVVYIDRTLAGFGSSLQKLYRRGLAELDRFTTAFRGGKPFAQLSQPDQVALVKELESWADVTHAEASRVDPAHTSTSMEASSQQENAPPADRSLLFALFAAVREHTIEGVFCDPLYGGNHNFIGWRQVGFPGAQWGYSAEQENPDFDAGTIPIKSLADLRREQHGQSKKSGREGGKN